MNLTQRLTDQNNGAAWRDCNYAGLPHRWVPGVVWNYWTCTRCPVDVRWDREGAPPRDLLRR